MFYACDRFVFVSVASKYFLSSNCRNIGHDSVPSSVNETLKQRNIFSNDLIHTIQVNKDFVNGQQVWNHDEGMRTVKFSLNGALLASGDKKGTLRVFNLQDFSLQSLQEAHDSEILSLDFSRSSLGSSSSRRPITYRS